MNDNETRHWLTRPRTIRRLWIGGGVMLAGLVLADIFVDAHPSFGVDGAFGFYAWHGLISCVAMILVAKGLGVLLKRKDDYYDD
ncbi:MAG: hypothetical protein GWP69_19920 [Gammaproteobacteria bacterium]|jgi:hypothetical protein|nr:hypothetical protein [Gammaproteobacteria bacterium]NCF82313.1 hypothetical protein [Pseudomonadota bacterium]